MEILIVIIPPIVVLVLLVVNIRRRSIGGIIGTIGLGALLTSGFVWAYNAIRFELSGVGIPGVEESLRRAAAAAAEYQANMDAAQWWMLISLAVMVLGFLLKRAERKKQRQAGERTEELP